jgi:hypothetical protein
MLIDSKNENMPKSAMNKNQALIKILLGIWTLHHKLSPGYSWLLFEMKSMLFFGKNHEDFIKLVPSFIKMMINKEMIQKICIFHQSSPHIREKT